MNPQHKNPTRKERTATAPYNFVPLPEKVIAFRNQPGSAIAIDQSVYHDDRFTGWIDVELETLSPVYIRAGLTPEQYEKMERQEKDPDNRTRHLDKVRNRPEFAHAGDPNVPVIPGSSLRGMIRTMCEIIGHGKLSPVSDQALVYRAVGDTSSHGLAYRQELMEEDRGRKNWFTPKVQAGYIRKGELDGAWYIQPAERADPTDPDSPNYARIRIKDIPNGLPHLNGFKQAYELYVAYDKYDYKEVRGGFIHIKRVNVTRAAPTPQPGLRRAVAVLARTGPVPRKATEAVIFEGIADKEQWIRIPDGTGGEPDLVAAYLDQVTKTGKFNQKELLGSDHGVLRDGYPVMYVMEGRRLLRFFGHTQMFRMPYRQSPMDLLSAEHKDEGTLDLAQAMFGTVRDVRKGAAGRVFVEDARLHPKQDKNKLWLDGDPVVMPKILSGPKPTTFQHYLTQSDPDVEKGKGLKTYNDRGQTTLRGHKLYWHPGKDESPDFRERRMTQAEMEKDSQHTWMKPVREGVRFCFRVRFENLLAEELGLLLWAVKLPAQGDFAHKIGMGKPLGLGSVQLRPALAVVDPAIRYGAFLGSGEKTLEAGYVTVSEEEAIRAFEKLAARALKLPQDALFADTPRMRALLAMLSWPGPPRNATEYMSVGQDETTGRITGDNQFKERPVLPDPLKVRSQHAFASTQ